MRICMDKWCQNELKWRLESHEQYWWTNEAKMNSNELKWRHESHDQYGWTNDAKMHKNEDLNPMSNMDGQMMPKYTQMKTRISWAIWMDKCSQNELKWRLESHEQYGWTIDAKMNTNEDLNPMSNIDGQMMSKWTQMNSTANLKLMSNMDGQMMPKWTQVKTFIPWAILTDKWCQNELKWRLESHEQYWWTNDAKWTQIKTWIPWEYVWTNDAKMNSNEDLNPMSNIDGQMRPKWTQMNSNEDMNLMTNMDGQMMQRCTKMKTWIPWAIWMDKWCQNILKWRLEYHEQYGWTNAAKMNSNEDLNPMSYMDGQSVPKWTQMKTWIPWAILMDKWCQNELKWTQLQTWNSCAIWMDKWCQNEHKWRLESHEQYEWKNDAKMNSNELKWRLESHEQYGWTNDAKMNSNEDLNTMSNMDGQMMPK